MRRGRRLALAGAAAGALLGVGPVACRRATGTSPGETQVAPDGGTRRQEETSLSLSRAPDGGLAPPRCSSAGAPVATSEGRIVGEGVAARGAVLVGEIRAREGDAVIDAIGGAARTVAKGSEMVADAPPPKPLVVGQDAYAVAIVRGARDAGPPAHAIVVARLGESSATRVATIATRSSESLAFDAAAAIDGKRIAIAWDDDARDGGIALALAPLDGAPPTKTAIVSSPTTDPEAPRIEPRAGGGFWIAWIERRPEGEPPDARAEAPAEDRTFAWLVLTAVDAAGSSLGNGAPRAITSLSGHVGAFDLAARASGELDLFVRDDTQEREGLGGRLVHVVARAAADSFSADAPATLLASGVGRASVDVLGGAWIAFSDPADRALLAPLSDARAFAAPPSAEETLEGARLIAVEPGDAPAGTVRFLAASAGAGGGGGEPAAFRHVECARPGR